MAYPQLFEKRGEPHNARLMLRSRRRLAKAGHDVSDEANSLDVSEEDIAETIETIEKYSPDQPRASDGKWTSGGSTNAPSADHQRTAGEIVATANRAVKVLKVPGENIPEARGMVGQAIAHAYGGAKQLARKAGHVLTHSRIEDIAPTGSGGIEIKMLHGVQGRDDQHLESRLQLHPWMISQHPVSQGALKAMHITSHSIGRQTAPFRANPLSVTFKNGPVPGTA
ncbi:MAG: hypothetical protein ACLQME_13680 [Alphaproteobacteria bacterium]